MAKPTGAVCNLDCEYCFFLSKEMLYPGSRFRMAEDLQETYIRQLLEGHARSPEVVVAWQGGEPTMMGLDFFRRVYRPGTQVRRAGPADPQHDPDERHPAGRRVGRVPEGERVPGRHLDRRAAGDARRLPGGQGRQADVRPGDARPGRAAAPRGRLERADHHPRGQRRPRPPGVRVLARRAGRDVHPVHSRSSSAATEAEPADRRLGLGRRGEGPPALHPGGEPGHPPLGRPAAVRALPDRRVRGVGPPRHRHRLRADVRHRAGELLR